MNNTASGSVRARSRCCWRTCSSEAKTTKVIDSLEIASVKFMNSVVERRQDVDGGNDDLALAQARPRCSRA